MVSSIAFPVLAPLLLCLLTASRAADCPPASPEKTEDTKVNAICQKMDTTISPGCALSVMPQSGNRLQARLQGWPTSTTTSPGRQPRYFTSRRCRSGSPPRRFCCWRRRASSRWTTRCASTLAELPDFGAPVTIPPMLHHTSELRDQWELGNLSGWRISGATPSPMPTCCTLSRTSANSTSRLTPNSCTATPATRCWPRLWHGSATTRSAASGLKKQCAAGNVEDANA